MNIIISCMWVIEISVSKIRHSVYNTGLVDTLRSYTDRALRHVLFKTSCMVIMHNVSVLLRTFNVQIHDFIIQWNFLTSRCTNFHYNDKYPFYVIVHALCIIFTIVQVHKLHKLCNNHVPIVTARASKRVWLRETNKWDGP